MPLSGAVQEIVFAGYVHGSATGLDGDGHLVLYSRVREMGTGEPKRAQISNS